MNSNMFMSIVGGIASSAGVLLAAMDMQQSPPAGTPSRQPGQPNPTPRPTDPGRPGQNQPGQNQPGDQTPLERQPGQTPLNRNQNPRFFSFADDTMEPRFRESTSRLAGLERSMLERNQRLTERLGAVRQLPPERQSAATLDLLQEILQENARLHEYLVQSRTLVTGDFDDSPMHPRQPGTTPNPNQPGSNPPRVPPR